MGNSLSGRPRRTAVAHVRATQPNCWLCGHPIDLTIRPKPGDPPWVWNARSTVDEVVPRSLGGSTTDLANLRHAHAGCNSSRGNRPPTRALGSTSRRW